MPLDFAPYLIQLLFVGEFDSGSDGVVEDDDLFDVFEGGFVLIGDDVHRLEVGDVRFLGLVGEGCD